MRLGKKSPENDTIIIFWGYFVDESGTELEMADYLKRLIYDFLFLRRATLSETEWFCDKQHNKFLVSELDIQIPNVIDCFEKYRRVSYDTQGIRDHGIDVLLRYDTRENSEEQMRYIGFQVKSYSDLCDDGWLTKLKAQVLDAINHVTMEDYYIVICTDAKRHISKIRDLQAELSKTESVHIVRPEYALNFYRLSQQRISAYLKAKLSEQDQVYLAAFESLSELTPQQSAIVIELVVAQFLEAHNLWNIAELRQQDLVQSTYRNLPNLPIGYYFDEKYDGETAMEDDIDIIWLNDLEILQVEFIDLRNKNDDVILNQSAVMPIAAVALDGHVRYGHEGANLRNYLMETLLGDKLRKAEDLMDKTQNNLT